MSIQPSIAALCVSALVAVAGSGSGVNASAPALVGAPIQRVLAGGSDSLADPAVSLPAGFNDTVVATVPAPTALIWTPDGRMLVTSKAGVLTVIAASDAKTLALDLRDRVCADGERGLVGVAVDPAFASNHFVYMYFTHKVRGSCGAGDGPDPENRVGRFVLGDDDQIVPASGTPIVDHIVSPSVHHIAGDLEFGADGFLYISVGDGVCSLTRSGSCGPLNGNSQARYLPQGKILRVTRNGFPPGTNPYMGRSNARRCTRPDGVSTKIGPCKEIFASGLRNPFRFARKPGTSTFFVNDVGMNTWEEVNRLGRARNYGWNVREGRCVRDSTTYCGSPGDFTGS